MPRYIQKYDNDVTHYCTIQNNYLQVKIVKTGKNTNIFIFIQSYMLASILCLQYISHRLQQTKRMIFDGDHNTSSSLEIVQPSNRMTFSSSSSQDLDLTNQQILNYSKDQSSLSFQIEEERKNSMIQGSILSNEPPKRKRKEIFDKYKILVPQQNQTKQILLNITPQNQTLKIFDQIFSVSTPRSTSIQEGSPNHIGVPSANFAKKVYYQNSQTNSPPQQSPERPKAPVQQQFNIVKTPEKTKNNQQREQQNKAKYDSPPDLFKSSQFFKTPLDISKSKPKQRESTGKNQILNLSDLQYRISFIDAKDQGEISRDSYDLAQILGAEIFIEKDTNKDSNKDINISKDIIINKDINIDINKDINRVQINNVNAKIQQQTANNRASTTTAHNTKIPEQNMQQSRFSDVYQRIDMSQSIANSVVMRDSKFQFFDQNQQFMGGQENIMRNFARTSSLKSIQSEQTLINALGSQRILEQIEQDKRVPLFLRKAVKLNSIVPNFHHPTVQANIDKQNENLQQIVSNFSNSLRILQKMLQKIKLTDAKKKELVELFSTGITLQKFTTSNWESCINIENVEQMIPKENFIVKQWNAGKVEKALQNYRKIVQNHRGIKINLRDQRGIEKYFQIRKKFWDIQKNILMIANDMYSHIIALGFQKHFIQYKNILNQNEVTFSHKQIKAKKMLLQKIKRLKNKGDELSLSQVGSFVISKLNTQIKFNSSNF